MIQILNHYDWNELHLIIGIGQDKSCEEMFALLLKLPRVKIYLTETPFKGRFIDQYPTEVLKIALQNNSKCIEILNSICPSKNDLVVVTGSLYLVGDVLKSLQKTV